MVYNGVFIKVPRFSQACFVLEPIVLSGGRFRNPDFDPFRVENSSFGVHFPLSQQQKQTENSKPKQRN
jgi:hypothetical protein